MLTHVSLFVFAAGSAAQNRAKALRNEIREANIVRSESQRRTRLPESYIYDS